MHVHHETERQTTQTAVRLSTPVCASAEGTLFHEPSAAHICALKSKTLFGLGASMPICSSAPMRTCPAASYKTEHGAKAVDLAASHMIIALKGASLCAPCQGKSLIDKQTDKETALAHLHTRTFACRSCSALSMHPQAPNRKFATHSKTST